MKRRGRANGDRGRGRGFGAWRPHSRRRRPRPAPPPKGGARRSVPQQGRPPGSSPRPPAGPPPRPGRVNPAPAWLRRSEGRVGPPAAAVTVVVPFSVPPPGLLAIVSVTLPVNPVATLPNASRAVTSTAGVMVAAAAVLVGCTVNTSCDAAAGVMLKVALVTPRSPSAEKLSVYPVPTLSIDKSENVATPPTAATVVVPERVPPPGLAAIATVTNPVKLVTRFPPVSSALS